MNTGIDRRPFKLLKPPEQSTAMVLARYANREPAVIAPARVEPTDILWRALRVGSLCAACAFAFLVLSERHLFQRSGQTVGSLPDSIQRVRMDTRRSAAQAAARNTVSVAVAPRRLAPPTDKGLKVTEFGLEVSPEFQELDGVELRLTGVNAAANTYDITVRTRDREFYRQDVRLEEHVPLEKNSLHGPELVVGEIGHDRVFGYLSEPLRHGRRRHHRRGQD
jgi:hypothetical protein